jgi:hypothetical protein
MNKISKSNSILLAAQRADAVQQTISLFDLFIGVIE